MLVVQLAPAPAVRVVPVVTPVPDRDWPMTNVPLVTEVTDNVVLEIDPTIIALETVNVAGDAAVIV